ncbi:hypothetical protein Q4485_08010 [Granulosicoccaceae sp. 1_MG-2023]|nr:hypothetical protein [Granulosicoccaceae sp. 1_MG-2023]
MQKVRALLAALVSASLLSACLSAVTQPTGGKPAPATGGSTPAQSERLAAQGCAVGAVGLGAITLLQNFGKKDANKRAAIAAMLGCIGGSVVGYSIGKRTDHYANARIAAEQETLRNRRTRRDLEQYNARLRVNIRDYDKQISMLRDAAYTQSQRRKDIARSKQVIAQQRLKAQQTLVAIDTELTEAQQQFNRHRAGLNQAQSAAWEVEIAALRAEREILSNHVTTLNAMDNSL